MATQYIDIPVEMALPASSNGGQHLVVDGTNFPVRSVAFDAATEETIFFCLGKIANYGSGNLTLSIEWYAATATSGDIIWGAAIAAITPNTDSQDIETKAFATAQTVTDSHIGTTGKRLHSIDLTISNLDSLTVGDDLWLKFYRDADAGGDTMTGDGRLVALRMSYSDT